MAESKTITADASTHMINLTTANICQEITWSGRHPKSVTLNFRTNAGGFDFKGPAGGPLSEVSRIDVDADSPYVIPIRSGQARNLGLTSIYVESDTANTDLGVAIEW